MAHLIENMDDHTKSLRFYLDCWNFDRSQLHFMYSSITTHLEGCCVFFLKNQIPSEENLKN